jgi:hypothetical protein
VSKFRLMPGISIPGGFGLIHSRSAPGGPAGRVLADAAPLSFDFSVRRDPAYIEPLLPHVRIAEFSLSDLDDAAAEAWLERIFRLGPRLVLATRGARDALLFDGQRTWRQPPVPTELIDTLGAGDAFIARFLVGIVRDEPFELSLADAAVQAATTCGAYGAFGSGLAFPPMPPVGPRPACRRRRQLVNQGSDPMAATVNAGHRLALVGASRRRRSSLAPQ